jgi:hypothetical protein
VAPECSGSGAARDPTRPGPRTRVLLCLGVVGPAVFVTVFLVEGATRPGYDPWSQPVSALALGSRGWRQRASFLVSGVAISGSAVGLRGSQPPSTSGPRLVAACGVGLIGAALATTDPVRGYDPDLRFGAVTTEGVLHQAAAVPVFIGLPAAALVYGRAFARSGDWRSAAGSVAVGLGMPLGAAAFGQGFSAANASPARTRSVRLAGLFQRLTIALGWSWIAAISVRAMRAGR